MSIQVDKPENLRRRRPRVKIIALAFLGLCLGLAVRAFLIEPDWLVVNQTQLKLESWPEELKGLRIAAISDIHAGAPYIGLDKIRHIVDVTNSTHPDLIMIAGDFVVQGVLGGRFIEPEVSASEMKSLHAKHGVFAVLGNHDWWFDGPRMKRALEGAGIKVLENDVAQIDLSERGGQKLWIAGFGDLWEGSPNVVATLRKLEDNVPVVALTHNPDLFPQVPARVALTIAGHTHGGQVAIPIIGRLIVPSIYGERYAAGHICGRTATPLRDDRDRHKHIAGSIPRYT